MAAGFLSGLFSKVGLSSSGTSLNKGGIKGGFNLQSLLQQPSNFQGLKPRGFTPDEMQSLMQLSQVQNDQTGLADLLRRLSGLPRISL
jgi:hypothetical protein